MQTDGQLIISLVVESTTKNKLYDNDVKVNSDLKLSVPLLQQTVEASIEKDATSKSQTISFQDHTKDSLYLYCKIIGILIISLAILLFISALIYLFNSIQRTFFRRGQAHRPLALGWRCQGEPACCRGPEPPAGFLCRQAGWTLCPLEKLLVENSSPHLAQICECGLGHVGACCEFHCSPPTTHNKDGQRRIPLPHLELP